MSGWVGPARGWVSRTAAVPLCPSWDLLGPRLRCCLSAALPSLLHLSPLHVSSYDWIDEDTIVAAIVPPGLGAPPRKPITPLGPKIEASTQPIAALLWCMCLHAGCCDLLPFLVLLTAWAQPHSAALAQAHSPSYFCLPAAGQ